MRRRTTFPAAYPGMVFLARVPGYQMAKVARTREVSTFPTADHGAQPQHSNLSPSVQSTSRVTTSCTKKTAQKPVQRRCRAVWYKLSAQRSGRIGTRVPGYPGTIVMPLAFLVHEMILILLIVLSVLIDVVASLAGKTSAQAWMETEGAWQWPQLAAVVFNFVLREAAGAEVAAGWYKVFVRRSIHAIP
eukprot:2388208-Rhodomonas_salina.1